MTNDLETKYMQHRVGEHYKDCSNYDPQLNLTYFKFDLCQIWSFKILSGKK